MHARNARYTVAFGFLLVLLLMATISAIGIQRMSSIKEKMVTISNVYNAKTEIINTMQRIRTERTLAIFSMLDTEDPFDRDDIYMRYKELAQEFIKLRERLDQLPLTNRQGQLWEDALILIGIIEPIQNQIVEQILDDDFEGVQQKILKSDLPLDNAITQVFAEFVRDVQGETRAALAEAELEYDRARYFMVILDLVTLLLGITVASMVIRRTNRIERALSQEKERAQITLNAIGDAVITVDPDGRIDYLNPMAQQLSGLEDRDAVGLRFAEVFRTISESNGEAIDLLNQAAQGPVSSDGDILLINSRGLKFAIESSVSPLRDDNGQPCGQVIVLRDVTHARLLTNQLTWQATHDVLTGLKNRRKFEDQLAELLSRAQQHKTQHAMLYIDLDQFKIVNDTCGHEAGDKLLQTLSQVIQRDIRQSDTLARLGGDEFGLLLENCPLEKAVRIANHLLKLIQGFRFTWQGRVFKVGASIGLVTIDEYVSNTSQLLSKADAACYLAKEQGRNRVWVHHPDDEELDQRQGEMEQTSRITHALEENRFVIYKQLIPPTEPRQGEKKHYEILIRMLDPDGEIISPMAFIPAAERYGIMTNIDRWLIKNLLRLLREQPELGADVDTWGINISAQSLSNDSFLNFVVEQIKASGVPPASLCFEITETAAIGNWIHATRFINVLQGMGCRFALDDFGSGMSSFSYLKNLRIDFLKIDGVFVHNLAEDNIDQAIVAAVHRVGQVMGIQTIAEFVENHTILEHLRSIGVDYAQGYGIHQPEPLITPIPTARAGLG